MYTCTYMQLHLHVHVHVHVPASMLCLLATECNAFTYTIRCRFLHLLCLWLLSDVTAWTNMYTYSKKRLTAVKASLVDCERLIWSYIISSAKQTVFDCGIIWQAHFKQSNKNSWKDQTHNNRSHQFVYTAYWHTQRDVTRQVNVKRTSTASVFA